MDDPQTIEQPTPTPPAVIEPDWNAIRDRYLQGDEIAGIAADFGVSANAISCRAYQNKWKDAQARLLLKDEALLSKEIRANILVSVLKESKMFQRLEPASNPVELDLWSKVRDRLVTTAGKLLGWSVEPGSNAKPAKCIDV